MTAKRSRSKNRLGAVERRRASNYAIFAMAQRPRVIDMTKDVEPGPFGYIPTDGYHRYVRTTYDEVNRCKDPRCKAIVCKRSDHRR